MDILSPSLQRPRSSNLTSSGLGQWHHTMLPAEVLTDPDLTSEARLQMVQAFPILLQLVNDVSDSIFLKDAEHFMTLVAEVLGTLVTPHDVTGFKDFPDVTTPYLDKLERLSDAVKAMFHGWQEGSAYSLTRVGRALVKYSKFRPVVDVAERKVKIYATDVLTVSGSINRFWGKLVQ